MNIFRFAMCHLQHCLLLGIYFLEECILLPCTAGDVYTPRTISSYTCKVPARNVVLGTIIIIQHENKGV